MRCSQCHEVDTKVIESRDASDGEAIRRRRMCLKCNNRFTTYERMERPHIAVIKHDGTRELFNRDKLLSGLYRACEKTPVTSIQLENLVTDIERQIYASGDHDIPTAKIGDMAIERLAKLNEVAYVRFASVYRRFKDITGFENELTQIRERKVGPV